ncbi:MAG: PKD domain-containing protein [Methanomicrobiales archaeon]|nr:PKD domain-containing protein [Methanomicrobiales archaeon]
MPLPRLSPISRVFTLALLVFFLLVTLPLVAPAGARQASGTIRSIQPGNSIFEYEQGLDLSPLRFTSGCWVRYLRLYETPPNGGSILNTLTFTGDTSVNIPSVDPYYGTYTVYDSCGLLRTTKTVTIRKPTIDLDLVSASSHGSRKDGTILPSESLAFRVTSPMGQYYYGQYGGSSVYPGRIKIQLRAPNGSYYTTFGGKDYSGTTNQLNLSSSDFYTDDTGRPGAFSLSSKSLSAGQWRASAYAITPATFGGAASFDVYFYIPLPSPPEANFTASTRSGTAPLSVTFTDSSRLNPTSWIWNMGDTNAYFTQNPTHIYTNPGTYTVSLQVFNATGSDTETKTSYITVIAPPPVAAFTNTTPRTGNAPFSVSFADQSTNTPTSWSWNFGDGSPNSTSQNPIHTYTAAGTYTVLLIATNSGGNDVETKTGYVTITAFPPVANFTASATTGTPPLSVTFTDLSSYSPTAWSWDFGDGSPVSTVQNPGHTYASPGTYTVTLTATNANGNDGETKTGYITVTALAPTAEFTAAPVTGTAPLLVSFTDLSTFSPTAWSWNFGDGSPVSTSQNPSHTYTLTGGYSVTLTVTNAYGSDVETKVGFISVSEPAPPPSVINTSSLTLSTSSDLGSVRRGDMVNITVAMTGWSSIPSDSVVLLDRSGDSMYTGMGGGKTRWDYAKEAAQIVVTNLNTQSSKYALFTFAKRGQIVHSFVSSPWPINNTLANMTYETWNSTLTPWNGPGTLGYNGTSNLRDGLYKSLKEIRDKSGTGHTRNLVVLTDGEFNYYGNPLAWGRGYPMTTKIRNYEHLSGAGCRNSAPNYNITPYGSRPGPSDWEIWVDRMVWPRASSRYLFPTWDYLMYDDLQGIDYKNFTGFEFKSSNQCTQSIDQYALWFPQSYADWPSNPMGHDHPNIRTYSFTDYQYEVCDPAWPYIDGDGVEHGNCALTEQNMSIYARNNGIRIFVVLISTTADLDTGLPDGINTSDDIMKILALSTGGKYYPVRNHAALVAAMADINREVSNAAAEDLIMDISDKDVEVNDVLKPNTAGNTQFGHVHREEISTVINNATGTYTVPLAGDWHGNATHSLHYNVGDLGDGETWSTVYTVQPWVRGEISVFGNTSKVTFKDGTTFSLPETIITVENTPPEFDEMPVQTVDIHDSVTFTVHATDADGDLLTYTQGSLPGGATFNPGTQQFSWTPTGKGIFTASFQVDDGMATDDLQVQIIVTDLRAKILLR